MEYNIRNVAMYLRKSRGDEEVDLDNHRTELRNYCDARRYQYTEFSEIGTSQSLQNRPQLKELLERIRNGEYDAIVVKDIDRIGRADDSELAEVFELILNKEVYIITPYRTFDLNNREDRDHLKFTRFMANWEYDKIVYRLMDGKRGGAERGMWTNGKPPYPYVYDRLNRRLTVDEKKRQIYRYMVERALQGYAAEEIAFELNRLGHKSPRNSTWSGTAVYRLLYDQTHLGKIVFNKTQGSGHKNKKTKPLKIIDKENWKIRDGNHEILKSQHEHDKIMELFAKRKIIPKRAREGAFALSGLVHCACCGYSMQITTNGKNENEYIKKCQKANPIGVRCGNRGIQSEKIISIIMDKLNEFRSNILESTYSVDENELNVLKSSIEEKKKQTVKEIKGIQRLQLQYEDGDIALEYWRERSNEKKQIIKEINREITELEERCRKREQVDNKERFAIIEKFYVLWENAENSDDKNRLLKKIVDGIYYKKIGDDIEEIKINFL